MQLGPYFRNGILFKSLCIEVGNELINIHAKIRNY